MQDCDILDLYFARDERAIAESSAKYGTYCLSIAQNILYNMQDAEECVNDTCCARGTPSPLPAPTDSVNT